MNDPFLKKWMEMLTAQPKTTYDATMTLISISSRVAKMSKRRQKIAIANGKCKKIECTKVYPTGIDFLTPSQKTTAAEAEAPIVGYCAGVESRSGNLEIHHMKSRPPGTLEVDFTCEMSFLGFSEESQVT